MSDASERANGRASGPVLSSGSTDYSGPLHLAVFALPRTLKGAPGEVFAENGPRRILVADFVIGADELPFGGAAPETPIATGLIITRPEGDATGKNRRWEFIPNQMRERDGEVPVAIGISSSVQKSVNVVFEGVFHAGSGAVF